MKKILILFGVSLFAVSAFAEEKPVEEDSTVIEVTGDQNILYDALVYALQRFPNLQEVTVDLITQVPVEMALFDYMNQLGDNPAAKSFVRDGTKISGAFAKARLKTQVGFTEHNYDHSHVYSQIGKTAGKVGTIFLLVKAGQDPKKAAMIGNHIGESIARFFIIAGKAHHSQKSELSIEEFIVRKLDTRWFIGSVIEGAPKAAVSNWVGWFVGDKLGVTKFIRSTMTAMLNLQPLVNLDSGVSFWINAQQENNIGKDAGLARKAAVYSSVFLLRGTVEFVTNMGTTYLMAPAARFVTDVAGDLYRSADAWLRKEHPVKDEL